MSEEETRPRAVLERWPIRIRRLTLLRRETVTPKMLRLTLGGPEHAGFESHIADEHVKLFFPERWDDVSGIPVADGDRLAWKRPSAPNRDYTVRRYDPAAGEVDIDFVVHEGGVAATWAQTASIGSAIWVAGPPRGIPIPDGFAWQAYLGDETALPAISRRLEELPATTRGVAIIEIADEEERQELAAPDGFQIRWISRAGRAPGTTTLLADAARTLEIPRGGGAYLWYGGEQGAIKPLRAIAKAAGLQTGEFDLTGYWRRGAEGNHLGTGEVLHAVKHLLRLPH